MSKKPLEHASEHPDTDKSTMIRSAFSSTESKRKPRKNKEVKAIRNPFADPSNNSDRRQFTTGGRRKNPFADSRVLVGLRNAGSSSNDDEGSADDSGGEEDEERMIKARRNALAALDPTNSDPKAAEFKSLKPLSTTQQKASRHMNHQQSDANSQQLESSWMPVHTESKSTQNEADITINVYTPPPSINPFDDRENNLLGTPKTNGGNVPEIAISMPTPSPPLSKKKHDICESSPTDTDHSRLSSTFKPSTMSNPFSDSPFDDCSAVPVHADAKSHHQPSTLHAKFFQRVTADSESETAASNEDVEDYIGTVTDRDPGVCPPTYSAWSPKRNTFGTPLLQGNQSSRQQRRDTGSKVRRYSHDPWDSDHDMLLPDMDVDQASRSAVLRSTETSLKGKIGGRRSEEVDVNLLGKERKRRSLFGRGGTEEDWMIHPRTAAIRGTFHRVQNDDAVPVPARPRSWDDEFTTVSLESPPPSPGFATSVSRNGAALSRTGSLDSSFHRLKKGASALLMTFGTPTTVPNDTKDPSVANHPSLEDEDDDQKILSRMNGHVHNNGLLRESNPERRDEANYRSSSLTFGNRKSLSNSPPPAMLPSFSSLRNLISTAASLGRSSSVPGTVPPPPFSASAFIRRSQTTAFGGHHEFCVGRVPGGQVSFSPVFKPKFSPAMIPTIVVPMNTPEEENSALTATTFPCPFGSASSSATVFSSNDGLGQQVSGHDPSMVHDNNLSTRHGHWMQPPEGFLLKVPEPARTIVRSNSSSSHPANAPTTTTVAMAAMHAAAITRTSWPCADGRELHRTPTSTSADSLAGPLMGEDYIGQFERERALARNKIARRTTTGESGILLPLPPPPLHLALPPPSPSSAAASAASLATTVHSCGSGVVTTSSHAHAGQGGGGGTTIKYVDFVEPLHNDEVDRSRSNPPIASVGKGSRPWARLFGFLRGTPLPSPSPSPSHPPYYCNNNKNRSHGRQLSGHSDITEKWMQLPEPSRFEGMCSGRGVINITSMVLILCGLVLLILGYPIAASLRKDQLDAAAATTTTTASSSSSSSSLVMGNNRTVTVMHPVQLDMAN